jgi:asparagine synthase (glutamine-hydrolysing)
MSRIVGFVANGQSAPVNIQSMTRAVASGSDWKCQESELGRVAMGWTGVRSPVIFQSADLVLVVDGCFFNRPELPRGESDAEVLASLYLKYGFSDSLQHINGDFAVALYDRRDDSFYLGRDRIGIKPLYYAVNASGLAFASRPRALLAWPGVSSEVNRKFVATFAASHYRYFDNDPHASPFADIAQLPASHVLSLKRGVIQKARYWQLVESEDFNEPEEQLAERYRELLLNAVAIRYQVANQPTFTLSGGMDSSSVLACAVQHSGQKQHAFSTVYEDKTYDESDDIRTILEKAVEQWHTVLLGTPNVVDVVTRMIEAHDEPVATATWLSHYLLCQDVANKGFGGLFGGLGGDELNAGEYEYFWHHFADLRFVGNEDQLRHEIKHWIKYHDHPIFRKSFELVDRDLHLMADLRQRGKCLPETGRMTKYYAALNPDYFMLESVEPVMDHPFQSYLKNRTYQDIFRETAPCCLRAEDRQATAFGLENFLPFFDYRLVEFMFRISGRHKIRDGVTKRLLRQATKGILPDETRNRITKTGWNAPAHVWFSRENREPLLDLIHSQSFRERGIYNIIEVERIVDDHQRIMESGKPEENHMMFLWQLVNLELWFRWLRDTKSHAYKISSEASQSIEAV